MAHKSVLVAAGVCVFLVHPAAQRPGLDHTSWRPTVVAQNGMVVAGHPLAAEAGLRILKSGGNAIDAAIATWAVQGEVEPGMTGLGADMFLLYYNAKTRTVTVINGTGFAPQAATIAFYRGQGGIPEDGPLSVTVPGAVGGAALAVKKYGTKSMAEVLAPAIEIAERGFPISETLAAGLAGSRAELARFPSTTRIWFKDGQPLEMGDILVNKDLAATLRRIAAEPDSFYRGDIARNTAAYMKANGGLITEADLASYEAFEDTPININYRGIEVYECPPNSQGFVMLEALNILEGFDLKHMGHNSASYLHVVTEALKLSFADRNRYVADPRFVPNIPIKALLSKEYAAARRAHIDPDRAIVGEPAPGDPARFGGAASASVYGSPQPSPAIASPFDPDKVLNLTTYLGVVDKDHNMVSLTSSLLSGFGSGMVVDKGGFFLNDRMRYFWLEPENVNSLQPRKRVRQTINPALALKDGKPMLVFGTPGADTQPQTQLQFFLNVVEFGMSVQLALEQPTVISNSFQDSYYPHLVLGKLLTPALLSPSVRDELARKGHQLDLRNVRGVGSVKGIMVHQKSGALMGGVSPTGDSYVMAW
jgi:gamma-glutamyltranspeptidase/glutathione hydrolase